MTGLLDELSRESRDALLSLGHSREYSLGEVLMTQGDSSTYVIVILDGLVKVTAVSEAGDQTLLAIRGSGDIVGELAGLSGRPRSATVSAAGPVQARLLRRGAFDGFLRWHPDAAAALSRTLAAKLWATVDRRIAYNDAVPVRLARVLLQLADQYGRVRSGGLEIDLPLTQPELASLVGAAEPTVHKALRRLRDAGALHTGYRRLVVNDLAALRVAAGAAAT